MAVRDLLMKEQDRGCLDGAMVRPLHGQMDTSDQQAIFDRPPPGKRKILLSTQIAETSITVEDVTVVVDCGLIKIQTYDALNKVRVLAPTWCALSVHAALLCCGQNWQ
jgi:HrpA-like RNA helicase